MVKEFFMHQRIRFLLPLLLIFVSMLVLPFCVQAATLDSEEQAFVTLINNYRQQNGLQPLKISDKLESAAEWMSADMAMKNYFSHTDSLGRDPFQRMTAYGYTYNTYKGENIAAGNNTASATFTQWKNSSGHNANMLNTNYKVMGIARATAAGSTYGWYWTNDFGGYDDGGAPPTPDTTPPTVSITAPANGATVNGQLTVSANATDNVGVKQVVFTVSNGTSVTDASAPYSTALDTTKMNNGSYTLTATAYDAVGNKATQSVTVTVKNTATTQLPGKPVNVQMTPGTTGAMVSWAPGTGGAPARYDVQVARYASYYLTLVQTLSVTAPTTSTRFTVSTTGTYQVRVRAVNAAGASAYSAWVSGKVNAGS
jgi:hypothetical protein